MPGDGTTSGCKHPDGCGFYSEPTFNVHCRVSGGVTGTREALLKANGIVQVFATRALAQERADKLNREMNNPYAVASFSYRVVEAS